MYISLHYFVILYSDNFHILEADEKKQPPTPPPPKKKESRNLSKLTSTDVEYNRGIWTQFKSMHTMQ